MNTTDAEGDLPMDQDIQVHKIPSEADFLIAYSVVPGKLVPNEPRHEKTCFCHMWTTKAQISLHIRAV